MSISLSGYKIGAAIGDGGMATVYKGLQISLQRPVAIKILKSKLIEHQEIRKRFDRESLIIARLNHPNIIHVIDQGLTEDGRPFFVMEYVKSIGLDAAMEKGSMTVARALDIFTQVAKALAYAHKNGVVHCDIKPENVLVDFEGFVRVLDFGIAQIYEDVQSESPKVEYIMGSENYMAPEQHLSITEATERSDIYALGVIMYLFFAKQLPRGDFPSPIALNPNTPAAVDSLIMQCLAKDPVNRPENADYVKNCLLKVLQGGHLDKSQQQRASIDVKKSFKLLDVIKESEHGSVYLFSEQGANTLFVIKKKPITSPGYHVAERMAKIQHPNVLQVYGTSQNARAFILVMEYCSGGSLADRLAKRYDLDSFYCIALQVVNALRAVQEKGMLHGNLRPTNILFDENECVKVADFGLDEHYGDSEQNWYALQSEQKVTSDKPIEPIRHKELADIYSLGVIFYQMLSGELPKWKHDRLVKVAAFTDHPEDVQGLVRKMLVKRPDKRLRSLKELNAALIRIFDDKKTAVRKVGIHRPEQHQVKAIRKTPSKSWVMLLLAILVLLIALQSYLFGSGYFEQLFSRLSG